MQQDQWHYRDERSGKRLGPVSRDQVGKMIAADRIDRSTLVWNPAMPQWAAASTTDLAGLFGDGPPPLPATEISRWAVYALAFFPMIGLAIQAVASAVIGARSGQNAQGVFDHGAWLLLFILGNGALGDIDEKNLRFGGLVVRFAATIAAFLTPIYIFASCRTFKRHAGQGARYAYLPLLIWVAAVAASVVVEPLLFNPDAPLFLRPDAWF